MSQPSQPRKRNGTSHLPISSKASRAGVTTDYARSKMAKSSTARNSPSPNSKMVQRRGQPSRVPAPKRQRRFPTSFCNTLRCSPPAMPPSLLKFASDVDHNKSWSSSQATKKKDNVGPGRVKVLLRVCPEDILSRDKKDNAQQSPISNGSILRVEGNRKHVTIFDSETGLQSAHMRVGVSAPKLYAFDAVFPEDASQAEVCSTSLIDVIQAVIQGADGAVFCYGHSGLGKTHTLIGKHESGQDLGIIPCAISWLFRAIDEAKDKTKGRFSIRVSAVEVHGRSEELKDLLKGQAKDDAPGEDVCVREDPLFGTQLQNQCELRASSAEKAAHYLDAALATRSSSGSKSTEEARRHSHMVYTLHVYQYRLDNSVKAGVTGGRSRLHFIDLGSCEKTLVKTPSSLTLSLNSLGHVIMAIINNSKHVPFKESKLTLVLQDLLGNFNCRTVMLAHVAKGKKYYAETLSTVQMASRIHRVLLKKKTKGSNSAVASKSVSGCHASRSIHSRKTKGTDDESLGTSSGIGETSGSEVSCDTVIYVRPNGVPFSDRELTDNEGPPTSVPVQPPLQSKKSLTKINENEKCSSGPLVTCNIAWEGKCAVVKPRTEDLTSKSKDVELKSAPPSNAFTTQLKLANHAKLVDSIRDGEHHTTRQSQSEGVKFKTTQCDRRSSKSPHRDHGSQMMQPQKCAKSPIKRERMRKSKIPPPPPPRLPSTRLRCGSDSRQVAEDCKNKAPAADNSFHQPTYETLHASHQFRCRKRSKEDESQHNSGDAGTFDKRAQRSVAEVGEYAVNNNAVDSSVTDAQSISSRSEPEGSDSSTVAQRRARVPGATAMSNLSYSTVTIDQAKTEISRCIKDLGDVLTVVEENEGLGDVINIMSQNERRPSSMVVNLNESEWNSDEDDDTFTSENDISDGEDVVGVNFYCLSFTTKNPLIPLSKRSFVRQVSMSKRMSLEGRSSGGSSTSDTSRDSHPDIQGNNQIEDNKRCIEPKGNPVADNGGGDANGSSTGKLKRSGTFDVESGLPISLLPDGSSDSVPNDAGELITGDTRSSEDNNGRSDENSTVSSPSQVLLYDSSSLEINYVKPKSFQENSQKSDVPETKSLRSSASSLNGGRESKLSIAPRKPPKISKDGKKILATGSGNGAQLSLVRSAGGDSKLEIVISGQGDDSPRQFSSHGMSCDLSSHSLKYAADHLQDRSSPAKRSKWGGLKRFGSKKSKERASDGRSRSRSPSSSKTSKKVEHLAVGNVKATSSSSHSFVSKLLSPKSRRGSKSSLQSVKTDFRYRSPNTISQTRPSVTSQSTFTELGATANKKAGKDVVGNLLTSGSPQHLVPPRFHSNRGRFGFSRKTKT